MTNKSRAVSEQRSQRLHWLFQYVPVRRHASIQRKTLTSAFTANQPRHAGSSGRSAVWLFCMSSCTTVLLFDLLTVWRQLNRISAGICVQVNIVFAWLVCSPCAESGLSVIFLCELRLRGKLDESFSDSYMMLNTVTRSDESHQSLLFACQTLTCPHCTCAALWMVRGLCDITQGVEPVMLDQSVRGFFSFKI